MNSCGNYNISTKLHGSKSSEAREESPCNSQGSDIEKGEGNPLIGYSINDFNVPRNTLIISQRHSNNYSSDHIFLKFKPRISGVPRNEFRMARGNSSGDRGRGSLRGRAFKKTSSDRDANSESSYHSIPRSKFQESLKNQDNAQNKYYDDKRINEDCRISKLLRRLCREDDYDHFMMLCKQVQENILAPENQRYIRRNLDLICDNFLDILHSGPGQDAKQHVSKCLGRIGYIMDQDFKRYMEWIFNKYALERRDDVKCLLMKSFVETLKIDAESPKLKEFSVPIMSQLQSTLENVDRSDLLVATVDAILLIIESYPETFSNYFRDTVDILVGWHIDSTQQKAIVAYASRSLQRLRTFWITDLQFTLTLLGQFLEDMESYDEELNISEFAGSSFTDETSPTPRECILRITSLISVFNTVTKSISDHLNPNLTPNVQWSFLMDCLAKMLKTVVKAVELNENNDTWVKNFSPSFENVENFIKYVKSVHVSDKYIEILLNNSNEDETVEEDLIKMIESMSINCKNDKENSKIILHKDTFPKEKKQCLLNLFRSLELKKKKNF